MLGCSRLDAPVVRARSVLAAPILVVAALAAACGGGSGDVKTFTLEVRDGDDVTDLYTRGIIKAVDLCTGDAGLVRAQWTFDDDDADKPVVQQYTNPGTRGAAGPQSVDCAVIPRNPDGSPRQLPTVETSAGGADQPAEDDGPSSQSQDEGGQGATSTPTAGPSSTAQP